MSTHIFSDLFIICAIISFTEIVLKVDVNYSIKQVKYLNVS